MGKDEEGGTCEGDLVQHYTTVAVETTGTVASARSIVDWYISSTSHSNWC